MIAFKLFYFYNVYHSNHYDSFKIIDNFAAKFFESKNKMKKIVLFCYLLTFVEIIIGQDTTKNIGTIKKDWQYYADNQVKWKPVANMDVRQSFLKDAPITIQGFQVGARRLGKYQMTLGYYWLTQNSQTAIRVRNINRFAVINLDEVAKINYFSFCFSYMFFNTKYIELGIPAEVGFAQMSDKISLPDGRVLRDFSTNFIPIQLGISLQWRVTNWVGLKGAVGIRQVITNVKDATLTQDFDGAYYSYGVVLYLSNIYKSIAKKSKK